MGRLKARITSTASSIGTSMPMTSSGFGSAPPNKAGNDAPTMSDHDDRTATMPNASESAPSPMSLPAVPLKAGEQMPDLEPLAAPHGVAAEHEAADYHRRQQG